LEARSSRRWKALILEVGVGFCRDYCLDLLFDHRLGWLKRYACEPDEAEPLGMILCAGENAGALARKKLQIKLHEAVRLARALPEADNVARGGRRRTTPVDRSCRSRPATDVQTHNGSPPLSENSERLITPLATVFRST
jgi:hypothetical protein